MKNNIKKDWDIIIIGAGIVGAFIAHELSKRQCSLLVIDKKSDVAEGATLANSAIIHAGYDPKSGTLKAKLNVEGNRLYPDICRKLQVAYERSSAFVVASDEQESRVLDTLLSNAKERNIPYRDLDGQSARELEPNLSSRVIRALEFPTTGIVYPWEVAVALMEEAVINNTQLKLGEEVTGISRDREGMFEVVTDKDSYRSKYIINAAGVYGDEVYAKALKGCGAADEAPFRITPKRGEYYVLDICPRPVVSRVIYPTPGPEGKGVLVVPTVYGNTLLGPSSEFVDDKEGNNTTAEALAKVKKAVACTVDNIPFNKIIRTYAGLRPTGDKGDFIIENSPILSGFVNVVAIDSPGLASAPAIADYVCNDIMKTEFDFPLKESYESRKPLVLMAALTDEEKNRMVEENPAYGRIVCRCGRVSEGEIVAAINRPVGATTVKGVKKRVGAGMGRCQGGFCEPGVVNILARELGLSPGEIRLDSEESVILMNKMPGSPEDALTEVKSSSGQLIRGTSQYSLIIIGGGSAGIAAALEAYKSGLRDILILEKDRELGGVLQQCIHNGFGLHRFNEELTGPAYAERYKTLLKDTDIKVKTGTMVMSITRDKRVSYTNDREGYVTVSADAIIMAAGCRERAVGNIATPGRRVSGVWSAGTAQKYINMEGYMVGRRVFILGSGDIGLIMARRMTLEGATVLGVAELMPYSNGLPRNIKQCLEDFDIPLFLSHTVTDIKGNGRLTGITLSKVDEDSNPIPGTEIEFEVDTLLLSVGLIPDNTLLEEIGAELDPKTKGPVVNELLSTTIPGIFACGNGLHVHDLVDYVSLEGEEAGRNAVRFIRGEVSGKDSPVLNIKAGEGVSYVLPSRIHPDRIDKTLELKLRVSRNDRNVRLVLMAGDRTIKEVKKLRVAPSEMEKLILTREVLEGSGGDTELVLRLVKDNQV